MVDPDLEKKDAEIDDELGVAVVFDEQEQEQEDEDEEGFEIKDESDDEEEVGAQEAEDEPRDVGEEELVIGGEGKKAKSVKVDKGIVSPHVIGGFDKFRKSIQIRLQLLMRLRIQFTSRRKSTYGALLVPELPHGADERVNVEVAMREKGLGWILRELAGDRQTKARTDAVNVDAKPEVPTLDPPT
ncbi:hypothetical protein APHAL10511_004101 [Amanita phalloides]|nr:hypothetical protein APHAL10511_004101 [Amanita phalloides]